MEVVDFDSDRLLGLSIQEGAAPMYGFGSFEPLDADHTRLTIGADIPWLDESADTTFLTSRMRRSTANIKRLAEAEIAPCRDLDPAGRHRKVEERWRRSWRAAIFTEGRTYGSRSLHGALDRRVVRPGVVPALGQLACEAMPSVCSMPAPHVGPCWRAAERATSRTGSSIHARRGGTAVDGRPPAVGLGRLAYVHEISPAPPRADRQPAAVLDDCCDSTIV